MKEGVVPRSGIDTDARWGYSHTKGSLLKLLNYLIKEYVEKRVDFILENYESEIYGYSTLRTIYADNNKHTIEIRGSTGGIHEYFVSLFSIFYNNVITFVLEKEIEAMLIAYLELLQLPLGGESFLIDDLKELIARCNDSLETDQNLSGIEKKKIELIQRTANFFLKILLDYAERKNMQIITFPR